MKISKIKAKIEYKISQEKGNMKLLTQLPFWQKKKK